MAMLIIDLFEMVDIDNDEREGRTIPLPLGEPSSEFILKRSPIWQLRQWIGKGLRQVILNFLCLFCQRLLRGMQTLAQ